MTSLKGILTVALAFGLSAGAHAKPGDAAASPGLAVKSVKQADGSVMERLALFDGGDAAPASDGLVPQGSEAWLRRMLDPTQNGLALKYPELFAEWLDAITEPQFMTALATVAMTPETYPRAMGKLIDPATVRNWAEFVDPYLYMRWMIAGFDPKFYQTILNRLGDPEKAKRWGAALTGESGAVAQTFMHVPANRPDARDWLQLPAASDNPWLRHRRGYRY